MNINKKEEVLLARLAESVESVRQALTYSTGKESKEMKQILTFALFRRLSVSFLCFVNYLMVKSITSRDSLEAIGVEKILESFIEKGFIDKKDEEIVSRFFQMYYDLTIYDDENSIDQDAMLKLIPEIYEFLNRFILTERNALTEYMEKEVLDESGT